MRDCEEETGIRAGRRDWGEEPGLVRPGCQDESLLVSLIYHPTKYITNRLLDNSALQGPPRISFPVFLTCNVGNCLNALLCSQGRCSKSFGESTPSRRPSKAHRSPNDLGQGTLAVDTRLSGSGTRLLKGLPAVGTGHS